MICFLLISSYKTKDILCISRDERGSDGNFAGDTSDTGVSVVRNTGRWSDRYLVVLPDRMGLGGSCGRGLL